MDENLTIESICSEFGVPVPVKGTSIYVPSAFYISHGEDDIVGGLAEIVHIEFKPVPMNKCNSIFVRFKEVGQGFNYILLWKRQEELKNKFGENRAYKDPDYEDYGERW